MPFTWDQLLGLLGGVGGLAGGMALAGQGQGAGQTPITGSQYGGAMGQAMQAMPQMNPASTTSPPAGGGGGGLTPGMMAGLGAASNMLQASGPSRMPVGFGQVMGAGIQGGLGGYTMGKYGFPQMQAQTEMLQNQAKGLADSETWGNRLADYLGGGASRPPGAPSQLPNINLPAAGRPPVMVPQMQQLANAPRVQLPRPLALGGMGGWG